jgi:hypothetical protein
MIGLLIVTLFGQVAYQVGARAAGISYSGGTVAGPGGVTLPITRVETVPTSGGNFNIGTEYGNINVQVPSNTFNSNVQLVIANAISMAPFAPGLGVNRQVSVSFLVAIYKDGVKLTGDFSHPITVVYSVPFIHRGDLVYVKSDGAWALDGTGRVRDGLMSIQISSDPVIAVLSLKGRLLPVVMPGERSASVALVQKYLNIRGFRLAVDGIYGRQTSNAVNRFQAQSKLISNGIVGPRTWANLSRTAPQPYPTLARGSQSAEVNVLRKLLIARGFNVAKSGRFDSSLDQAVKRFQSRHNMAQNGIVKQGFWLRIGVQ